MELRPDLLPGRTAPRVPRLAADATSVRPTRACAARANVGGLRAGRHVPDAPRTPDSASTGSRLCRTRAGWPTGTPHRAVPGRAKSCQVVPRCDPPDCTLAPLGTQIAPKPPFLGRIRAKRIRPCRTRSECGQSCQLVPGCARKCPGVPRVGGCGVAVAAWLCHVVPSRATL